jgi:hypothetical protein
MPRYFSSNRLKQYKHINNACMDVYIDTCKAVVFRINDTLLPVIAKILFLDPLCQLPFPQQMLPSSFKMKQQVS